LLVWSESPGCDLKVTYKSKKISRKGRNTQTQREGRKLKGGRKRRGLNRSSANGKNKPKHETFSFLIKNYLVPSKKRSYHLKGVRRSQKKKAEKEEKLNKTFISVKKTGHDLAVSNHHHSMQ